MNWHEIRTLVTGGTSFIGSHLVKALVDRGSRVRVVDNLSSGRKEYLNDLISDGRVELDAGDLLDQGLWRRSVQDIDLVFYLAGWDGSASKEGCTERLIGAYRRRILERSPSTRSTL